MAGRWSDNEVAYLISNYPTHTFVEIQRYIKRSQRAIQHKALELHLRKTPRYIVNHSFFDVWSSDMAYILGFTITDGCISGGRLSFGVAAKDKCVLTFISSCITPGKKIGLYMSRRNGRIHEIVTWKAGSRHMLMRLLELGVVPRKTGYECLPEYIPNQYKADLLRGIFDGDGCATIVRKQTNQRSFNIASASRSFLLSVQARLGFGLGYVRPKDNIWVWLITKQRDIDTIRDFMYHSDNVFCLERKKRVLYVRDCTYFRRGRDGCSLSYKAMS